MTLTAKTYEILIHISTIFFLLATGCSALEQVAYHPNISQGNYFTAKDISKIHVGLTQKQIIHILGSPMMTDPFGSITWFYVFREQSNHYKIIQKTLILSFNERGVLVNLIRNKTP